MQMAHDRTTRRTGAWTHHYDLYALTKRVGVGGLSFRAWVVGEVAGAGLLQTRTHSLTYTVRQHEKVRNES